MRRIFNFILILFITCFSFYYTEKIIEFSKKKDPIMQEIERLAKEKEVSVVNGILSEDSMLVGRRGYKIDIDASYEKMKSINKINELLLEYIEIKPTINKKNNYDKLIIGKNTSEKEISLIFKDGSIDEIEQIIYVLKNNNVSATFFLDGSFVENNIVFFKNNFNSDITLGYYDYKDNYDRINFRYLKNSYKKEKLDISNYCLFINNQFLNTCISNNVNTIYPKIINNNLYNYFKNNVKTGNIYEIIINEYNIRQLNGSIVYLKQKGYDIVNIVNLLKE